MRERQFRLVRCEDCVWQDFYQVSTRLSYPPRCPECGSGCEHEFTYAAFKSSERCRLGRDNGIRYVFGDPLAEWKRERDRRWSFSYTSRPQAMYQ